MEKELLLTAEIRKERGKRCAAKMRKEGRIPAIVYGLEKEPQPVVLDERSLTEGLHAGKRFMKVKVGDETESVIVKDVQYDYLGKKVCHVDFMRVDVTKTIKVDVPLEFKGTPKGAQEGGILEMYTDRLEIECRVTEIPESLVVSVKEMNVGDSLHAKDVKLPETVKLISSPDILVASCKVVVEAKTTEAIEAETPAVPEVIGEVERAAREAGKAAEGGAEK